MSIWILIAIIVFGITVLALLNRTVGRRKKRLNKEHYQNRWGELLTKVKSSDGMVLAVIEADKLLDDVLKKSNYRGKTMGERLVSAQRTLTNNDGVWYAHKLRNRLVHEPGIKLKENEAKQALSGFRQGLKDLGAL